MIETTSDIQTFAASIDRDGWAVVGPVLDIASITALRHHVSSLAVDGRGGARNLFDQAAFRALAAAPRVRALAAAVLGDDCFAVRALFFDKTPSANWKVVWHQDLTIATRAAADVPGFGPWSEKAGVPHVQPPVSILERMLAVRVHLDPCGTDNGPVRVLSASHREGRLSAAAIDAWRARDHEVDCLVEEGGGLAFRPLILHASAPAVAPAHRRVIHIEYANVELPTPLDWRDRI
jgi:ectoine hydroxylase-related dioxygenase (phytanoyl-CoA dioxygenase family)